MLLLRVIHIKEGQTVYTTETVYNNETGLPACQFTKLDGVVHSPPDDNPAYVLFDKLGRIREQVWYIDGEIGRIGGPATIKFNPENGVHTLESYSLKNVRTRSRTEPAVIVRDQETGKVQTLKYFLDGVELPPPTPKPLAPNM